MFGGVFVAEAAEGVGVVGGMDNKQIKGSGNTHAWGSEIPGSFSKLKGERQ